MKKYLIIPLFIAGIVFAREPEYTSGGTNSQSYLDAKLVGQAQRDGLLKPVVTQTVSTNGNIVTITVTSTQLIPQEVYEAAERRGAAAKKQRKAELQKQLDKLK